MVLEVVLVVLAVVLVVLEVEVLEVVLEVLGQLSQDNWPSCLKTSAPATVHTPLCEDNWS